MAAAGKRPEAVTPKTGTSRGVAKPMNTISNMQKAQKADRDAAATRLAARNAAAKKSAAEKEAAYKAKQKPSTFAAKAAAYKASRGR